MKQRKIPERMCVACGKRSGKGDLIRIVRLAEGGVVRPDPSGKAPGRGAYICQVEECVAKALKQRKFDRALRTQVSPQLAEDLTVAVKVMGENKK